MSVKRLLSTLAWILLTPGADQKQTSSAVDSPLAPVNTKLVNSCFKGNIEQEIQEKRNLYIPMLYFFFLLKVSETLVRKGHC